VRARKRCGIEGITLICFGKIASSPAGLSSGDILTSGVRILLRRQSGVSGKHGSLVKGACARGYRELSLARFAPHPGELACAGGNAALRVTGTRRMGDRAQGAPLCSPGGGSSGGQCEWPRKSWHSRTISLRKVRVFLVAREGIEPRHADFQSFFGDLRSLSINHLQHLAGPFPGTILAHPI
jgi:hypothetical protein